MSRTGHQMERMERLVNDLVDVSRIQAGKLELRLELVDLAAMLREVVEHAGAGSARAHDQAPVPT